MTPQTPYCAVVRNAATRKPRTRFSVLTPTRKAVLMIVPRAVRMRRPLPACGRPVDDVADGGGAGGGGGGDGAGGGGGGSLIGGLRGAAPASAAAAARRAGRGR